MNNTEELLKKFREKFVKTTTLCARTGCKWPRCKNPNHSITIETFKNDNIDVIESFLLNSIREAEQRVAEDICSMTDDIEVSNYADSSMEIWKLFKHIRNSIRDKYVLSSTADANKMVVNKEESVSTNMSSKEGCKCHCHCAIYRHPKYEKITCDPFGCEHCKNEVSVVKQLVDKYENSMRLKRDAMLGGKE